MGNDSDSGALIGEFAKTPSRTRNHRGRLEEITLRDGESVKAFVLLCTLNAPLSKAIRHVGRQIFDSAFKPLRGNCSHLAVEVGTDAVEIHPED